MGFFNFLGNANTWCGPQCCGPAHIPAFNLCNPAEVKAKRALDDFKSFLSRRGVIYLPKEVQEYYRAELAALQQEMDANGCQRSCGNSHNIITTIGERATDRLAELQSDIDLATVKEEEQRMLQAQAAQTALATNISTTNNTSVLPLPESYPAETSSFLAQNKILILAGGASLAVALGILLWT